MDEDWAVVKSLLPPQWRELARSSGALKGLRKDRSPEALMRTLLLHVGCGHSLRETALRAREAKLADMSDVAVFKRLRKSSAWLHAMCVELFRERGIAPSRDGCLRMRAIDTTTVKEPGRTGSLWRLRYSIDLSSLACDFFRVTDAEGGGSGGSLRHFPVAEGDHVLADGVCSTVSGLRHVVASGGHATVRVDTGSLPLRTPDGLPFDLSATLSTLTRADAVGNWRAAATDRGGAVTVAGRVCAIGKSREAIRRTEVAPPHEAVRKDDRPQRREPETVRHVIVFTTLPEADAPTRDVLECYRLRWQLECVFKRLRSLAQLGHLPKDEGESAVAWLHGKLLVALLAEKSIRQAEALSPWGHDLERTARERSSA